MIGVGKQNASLKQGIMKEILIFGSGVHSKVILSEIIHIKGYKVIGFIDENLKKETVIATYNNQKYKVVSKYDSYY